MPTTLTAFSVLTSSFNAASSGSNYYPFGFEAKVVELYNLGSVAIWAKLGSSNQATTADLCVTSCASGLPNAIFVNLGAGSADRVMVFATSTAGQFAINAIKPW